MLRRLPMIMVLCLAACPDDGDAGGSGTTAVGPTGGGTRATATTGGSGSAQTDPTSGQEGDADATAGGQDTGGGEGCCERHAGGGCNEPEVAACVCKTDAVCCTFDWDDACVDLARNSCDATCEAVDEGVDDVADTDEGVADTAGDDTDTTGEVTDTTDGRMDTAGDVMDTGGGGGGDCCDTANNPGCSDMGVETCVCNQDKFCCAEEWDNMCVSQAITDCGLDCGAIDPSCCAPHPSPGCDDMTVQQCVCDFDPFCCNQEWDGQCVEEAAQDCMAGC